MEPCAEERSSTMSLSSGEHISDGEESIRSDSRLMKDLQKQAERWADCTAEWRDRWGKIRDERDFALKKARSYKKRLEEATARLQQLEADNQALRVELKRPLPPPQQQQQQQQRVAADEGIGAEESTEPVPTVHFRRRSEPAWPHSFSLPSSSNDDGLGSSAESSSPPIPLVTVLDLSAFSLETELKLIQDLVKTHERGEPASDAQSSPRLRVADHKVLGPVEGDRHDFSFWQHKKSALSKSVSADELHSDGNPAAAAGGKRVPGVPSTFPSASPEWSSKAPPMEAGTASSGEVAALLSGDKAKQPLSEKGKLSLGRKVELPSERPPESKGEMTMQSGGERPLQSCSEGSAQSGGEKMTKSMEDKATQSWEERLSAQEGRSERPPEDASWNVMAAQSGGEKGHLGEKSSSGKMMSSGGGGAGGEMVRKGGVLAKGNRPFVDLATRKAMYAAAVQQVTRNHPPLPARKTYSLSQDSTTTHSITPLGLPPSPSPRNEANPTNEGSAGSQPPLPAGAAVRRSSVTLPDSKPSGIAVREKKETRSTDRRGTWTAGLPTSRATPFSLGGAGTMPHGTRLPLRKS